MFGGGFPCSPLKIKLLAGDLTAQCRLSYAALRFSSWAEKARKAFNEAGGGVCKRQGRCTKESLIEMRLTHSSSHGASVGAADLLGGGGGSGPKTATASARVCARAHTTPPAGLIACIKLGLTPSNRKGQTAHAKKRETLRQLVQV